MIRTISLMGDGNNRLPKVNDPAPTVELWKRPDKAGLIPAGPVYRRGYVWRASGKRAD